MTRWLKIVARSVLLKIFIPKELKKEFSQDFFSQSFSKGVYKSKPYLRSDDTNVMFIGDQDAHMCGYILEIVEEEEDKFYDFLQQFAEKKGIVFASHTNKKSTFKDLNVGEKFLAFPIPGDNSGHGGFLGAQWIFKKIKPNQEKNAIRNFDGICVNFYDGYPVLKIA